MRVRVSGSRGKVSSSVTCASLSLRLGPGRLSLLTLQHSTHGDKPLDCWRQVEAFKAEVAKLEQVSVLISSRKSLTPAASGFRQVSSIESRYALKP